MEISIQKIVKYKGDGFEFTFHPIEDSIVVKRHDKGYTVKYMAQEEDCYESPREWDNLGTMVCFHRRYDLGDKTDLNSDMFNSWDELEKYLLEEENAVIVLPLRLYDHSGLSISTSSEYPFNCRWDSGQIGFIYVTKEQLRKEYSVKRITKKIIERAKEVLLGEVKTYDQYLRGDVYIVVREEYDLDKNHIEYDCCGGYYGYHETLKDLDGLI